MEGEQFVFAPTAEWFELAPSITTASGDGLETRSAGVALTDDYVD